MSVQGTLIAESLRVGAVVEGVPLTVRKVSRADCGDTQAGQPRTWTFIEFAAPAGHAASLATLLSVALEPTQGWYCDFRTSDETYVVFAGRIFRYARGDRVSRAAAEHHARSVGVPESQLDWPE
jgi:hypothetical protein